MSNCNYKERAMFLALIGMKCAPSRSVFCNQKTQQALFVGDIKSFTSKWGCPSVALFYSHKFYYCRHLSTIYATHTGEAVRNVEVNKNKPPGSRKNLKNLPGFTSKFPNHHGNTEWWHSHKLCYSCCLLWINCDFSFQTLQPVLPTRKKVPYTINTAECKISQASV